MNEINQKHQSIKFDFKFSKESIEFLDTLVYIDSKNRLQTTLYKKQTDCTNYLLAKSAHPFSLKKSIPYSQALRIKRICSTFQEYRKHSQDLIKRFVEKSYNEPTVRKQIEWVGQLDRSLLLKHCKPKRKDSIPFSVTYNSVLPNIKEKINKHWHILNIDSSFNEIFNSSQLMLAFRKLKTTYRNKHKKKQPKIYQTYTNNNGRSVYPMLYQSIALLPTSSQNNDIYKNSNQRDHYNFSPSHFP